MRIKRFDRLIPVIIFLCFVSFILENLKHQRPIVVNSSHALDFIVFFVFASIFLTYLIRTRKKLRFIKSHIPETLFFIVFFILLIYAKFHYFAIQPYRGHNFPTMVILAICLFNAFRELARTKKVNFFFQRLSAHPAQTIILSFVTVILVGTMLLMIPIATQDRTRLGFTNSLFTATSATCVTGLIVVDTATRFSIYGKTVIMLLMQVGGLGIMILAAFTGFLIGKRLSLQNRITMSYMLDESDARNLARVIKNIILLTLGFELCGALLLFMAFRSSIGSGIKNAFFSVFHSVSAFCNAGFSLFSDNLEGFCYSVPVNGIIAGLIIAGGISFAVLINSHAHLGSRFRRRFIRGDRSLVKLTLNTKAVLVTTVILIVIGTLLIYVLEHKPTLLTLDLKTQYLESFFQSVTLRTAGFNTMDISKLQTATYVMMMLFMFIGGASGSTAGGIKVNTLAVCWAYVKSVFGGKSDVALFKHSISKDLINRAFLVILLSVPVLFTGTLLLCLTENKELSRVAFECFSAFGTVGLSTGITPYLTVTGKMIIVLLMIVGRLGPLTLAAALSYRTKRYEIRYPEGRVYIG